MLTGDGCAEAAADPHEALEAPDNHPITDIQQLKEYFRDQVSEVVCVVEGIDPLTSGTFQALQSYRFDEIVWDARAQLKPCLNVAGERIMVDLDMFHEVMTVDPLLSQHLTPSQTKVTTYKRKKKTHSHRHSDAFFQGTLPKETA